MFSTGCGGILKWQQGSIQSPSYPLEYPNDHTCRWVIVGSAGTVVQLTWQSFNLEGYAYYANCAFDKVVVFDNSSVPDEGGVMGT
jgi:cubilin